VDSIRTFPGSTGTTTVRGPSEDFCMGKFAAPNSGFGSIASSRPSFVAAPCD